MIKKLLKSCAAALLAAAVTASGTGAFAESVFDSVLPSSEIYAGTEDKHARIIVELSDKPLLAYGASLQAYSSVGEYISSSEAQSIESRLAEQRTDFKKAVARSGIDAEVVREYSSVLNGVALNADPDELDGIKKLDGVKNAFIEGYHELVRPIDNSVYTTGSIPSIGADTAERDFGYTGKGSAVAILDTGLYTAHEAFGAVNSPKYEKNDIESLIQNNRLTIGKLSVNSVYVNDKIPFAFDYADLDTNVSGGESHGTHVAGIVGANNGSVIRGVAPDAQLFIMKIFGNGKSGAYDADILSALDDSIKLGVDAINMSLGSDGGFSEASERAMREVYERVRASGIGLYCAAGNAYSATYRNSADNGLPKASQPDNGIVGSPSTYSAAVSVASMNNAEATSPYILAGSRQIRYNDSAEDKSNQIASLNASFEYVDCGMGGKDDFDDINVKGKIALIQRGGFENDEFLTFRQKESYAKSAGAAAAIIYDNVEGSLVSMATDHSIPCVFISKADGEYLLSLEDRRLTVSEDNIGHFTDSYSGKMSDFSSWGTTLDLQMKPEITAPGGDIYSALPNNLYGSMSGTSMACPHMAGAAAVMDQYIREELDGLNMTEAERSSLAIDLMMSTAVQLYDENNNLYSPRKQGAGLVQLSKAVTTGAYLTSADGGKPESSMGYSTEGVFDFTFNINYLRDKVTNYTTDVTVITESAVEENGIKYMAQASRHLTPDEAVVEIHKQVPSIPSDSTSVAVQISLTEQGKANLLADFENGIYVEGFVTLTPENEDDVILSYPFMGFFGDWNALPVFDSDVYDDETPSMYEMQIGQFSNSTGGGYILGMNRFVDGDARYSRSKLAIQGGDSSKHVTSVTSLLRNVDSLTFSAEDNEGNTVYSETSKNERKTYYMDDGYHTPMAANGWTPFDTWGSPLPDGSYTYTITAKVGSNSQSVSYPIAIDNEAPQLISSVFDGSSWNVKVRDNHYIQAVCVTATGSTPLTPWTEPEASRAGETSTLVYDLNSAEFKGISRARIAIIDYAGNQYLSDYITITNSGKPEEPDKSFDVNGDGSVDILDITYCRLYYRAARGSSDWSLADVCDVDGNGVIDIEDMILIRNNMN